MHQGALAGAKGFVDGIARTATDHDTDAMVVPGTEVHLVLAERGVTLVRS